MRNRIRRQQTISNRSKAYLFKTIGSTTSPFVARTTVSSNVVLYKVYHFLVTNDKLFIDEQPWHFFVRRSKTSGSPSWPYFIERLETGSQCTDCTPDRLACLLMSCGLDSGSMEWSWRRLDGRVARRRWGFWTSPIPTDAVRFQSLSASIPSLR